MPAITMPALFPVTMDVTYVGPRSTFFVMQERDIPDIKQAIRKGATHIIICDTLTVPDDMQAVLESAQIRFQQVSNIRQTFAMFCADAAFVPAERLNMYAVAGTKGTATTASLLHRMLKNSGRKVALLSGDGNYVSDQSVEGISDFLRPDFLHQFLRLCLVNRVTDVVMEVPAQALTLEYLYDIECAGVIFTSFSPVKGEGYSFSHDYFVQHCKIFSHVKPNALIILNADDSWTPKLLQQCNTPTLYSLRQIPAHITATVQHSQNHIDMTVLASDGCCTQKQIKLHSPTLCGNDNAYNILAATAMAIKMHIAQDVIISAIQ